MRRRAEEDEDVEDVEEEGGMEEWRNGGAGKLHHASRQSTLAMRCHWCRLPKVPRKRTAETATTKKRRIYKQELECCDCRSFCDKGLSTRSNLRKVAGAAPAHAKHSHQSGRCAVVVAVVVVVVVVVVVAAVFIVGVHGLSPQHELHTRNGSPAPQAERDKDGHVHCTEAAQVQVYD